MDRDVVLAIVGIVPQVLLLLLAGYLILRLEGPVRERRAPAARTASS